VIGKSASQQWWFWRWHLRIGTPSLDEFYAITSRRSRDYIRALPIRKKRPFPTLFPHASTEAIDFLSKTLVSLWGLSLRNQAVSWPPFSDFRSQETYDSRRSPWASISFCICKSFRDYVAAKFSTLLSMIQRMNLLYSLSAHLTLSSIVSLVFTSYSASAHWEFRQSSPQGWFKQRPIEGWVEFQYFQAGADICLL
jgi:hypothetical protein